MDELAAKLFDIQAIKFGSFTLKSGLVSPIYFDLRVIISYPTILEKVANLLWERCNDKTACALICGVPYTALPMATLISVKNGIPMLLRRKEAKDYGTKKLIEGDYKPGQNCLIVEDVVTSGTSILETANELRKIGLEVTEAVVLLDRKQGGGENLAKHGITMSSVFHIEEFMESLEKQGLVDQNLANQVSRFIKGNPQPIEVPMYSRLKLSLEERVKLSRHPIATKLFQLMISKQSNLCVAADLPNLDQVIQLVSEIGPKIVLLKIHVDIFEDFSLAKIQRLKELAKKFEFLIMEDRKFADIANTTQQQFSGGIYKISEWSDMVTVHALPGPDMVKQFFVDPDVKKNCGCVLVLEMSTAGALTTADYTKDASQLGIDSPEVVLGFVGQCPPTSDWSGWIQFTPGVSVVSNNDSKGQQYCSPTQAVLQKGADVIIVGRSIINHPDALVAAEQCRAEGWDALMKRIEI